MGVVWYRFRADARRGWKAWLAVAIVTGLGAGIVLALVAGARRTGSAVNRFVAASNAAEVTVVRGVPGLFDFAEVDLGQVAALPEVKDSVPALILAASGTSSDGVLVSSEKVNFAVDPTGRTGTDIDRYKMLAGRPADPTDPREVVVSFRTAEAYDLDVGDTIATNFLDRPEQRLLFDFTSPDAVSIEQMAVRGHLEQLRVVGVYVTAADLRPSTSRSGDTSALALTPAAFQAFGDAPVVEALTVRLRGGMQALPRFLEGVEALGGGKPVLAEALDESILPAKAAIEPVGRALLIAGLLFGVVVVLLGGQALARQASSESDDHPTLVALGFSQSGLVALGILKAAAIALVSTTAAFIVALALSPLFPTGLADIAEPEPGFRADAAVLGLGVPTILFAMAGLGAITAWWAMQRAVAPALLRTHGRPERTVAMLARAGASPPLVAGVQTALRGAQGRAITATVSAIALGVLTTTGAIAFTRSLDHLSASPPLYGWNFDVLLGSDFTVEFSPEVAQSLARDPAVAALAVGDSVSVDSGGERVMMLGIERVTGTISPSLIRGRSADAVGEVVVVPGVADVGDQISVGFGGASTQLRVVGVAALPDAQAMTTLETLRRLAPETATQLALVRLRDPDGRDNGAGAAEIASFGPRAAEILGMGPSDFSGAGLNAEVANFGRVERLPAVLACLMGLVAVGTLLHVLSLSVRRRRRELAVLKAVGFTRRQVLATVSWQATTLVGASLAIGVPVGVAVGRGLWLRFAEGLGVVPVAVVPVIATAGVVVLALLIANVAAAVPGWRAATAPAAQALRTE